MHDLSPVNSASFARLTTEIRNLRRGGGRANPKPHKLLLLLAVIDLFDDGLLEKNRIYLDSDLIARFEKWFRAYADSSDWCQPGPPYFHLRSSDFWHHAVKPGREEHYGKLKTSGGGIGRIRDNIQYAYLSSYAYDTLLDTDCRNALRELIFSELELLNGERKVADRIGTVFHESFSLSRPSIIAVMNVINDGLVTGSLRKALRAHTHLGSNYVKAMPNYGRGVGLLDADAALTEFGKMVLTSDPLLESSPTLWLMHYFLSAPHGPGPSFWGEFVSKQFKFGNEITRDSLASNLLDYLTDSGIGRVSASSANSTATVFLGTYTKDDGLGRLGILDALEDRYRVMEPDPPPLWAFAVALIDFWQQTFPDRLTINLDDLYAEGGLSSIFMIGSGRINRYLGQLQQAGLVDVFRVAPPYQVALLRPDIDFALQQLYAVEDE